MKVIVIGGGPAGMIAAGFAAENGAEVTLLEKNEKLGKKLYITGKGRCNLTNNTDVQGLLAKINTNPRFLQSAFNALTPQDLIVFFEKSGTSLKTERGNRVFPVSDKAQDITDALEKFLRKNRVKITLKCSVQAVSSTFDKKNKMVVKTTNGNLEADAVIIATGGLSYPSTGSTGDGYRFAKALNHNVTDTFPSLVAINVAEPWVADVEGLSLRNVRLTLREGKILYQEMGEMLFTRTGVSGPLVLSASAIAAGKSFENLRLEIDLKPALTNEQLDARILRDFAESPNRNFATILENLLPKRIIPIVISLTQIPADKKVNVITKQERQKLVSAIKVFPFTPTGTPGYREAVITKGGVDVKEINPKTMMSKKIPGLFFAGEVLDVDAMTGGYNLQIAFSTGYAAGIGAAKWRHTCVI